MAKLIRFIPQIYMLLCMTLSISFIHYLMGDCQNFWKFWLMAFITAAPLAFFYSYWIGPIMKKLGANHPSQR